MEREPSDRIETEDGEIISRADYDAIQGNYKEDPAVRQEELDERLDEEATLAAAAMIDVEDAREEALQRAAEAEYDRLHEEIERREDQGVDATALRQDADRLQRRIDELAQNRLNRRNAREIRQAKHRRDLAEIEQISDPDERESARVRFFAEEKARESRRGQRS